MTVCSTLYGLDNSVRLSLSKPLSTDTLRGTQGDKVDSTALYPVHKWRLDRMIYEVERGRACGELVTYQAHEIQKGIDVEVELRAINHAQAKQIVSLTQEKAIAYGRVEATEEKAAIQQDLTKHERRQKNKWRLAAVALGVVVGLQFVFGGP